MFVKDLICGGIAALIFSASAFCNPEQEPPAVPQEATTALFGGKVSKSKNPSVRSDPEALTGTYVAATVQYHAMAQADVPDGDGPFHIWIRYRNLALQMKTPLGGDTETKEFPWNWNLHRDRFEWRKVGSFGRLDLGSFVFFVGGKTFSGNSGVDGIVITADENWHPEK